MKRLTYTQYLICLHGLVSYSVFHSYNLAVIKDVRDLYIFFQIAFSIHDTKFDVHSDTSQIKMCNVATVPTCK